jgi:hypothetical protein
MISFNNAERISWTIGQNYFGSSFFLKNSCIAGLSKYFLKKNGSKRSRPDDQVIFMALSAWT